MTRRLRRMMKARSRHAAVLWPQKGAVTDGLSNSLRNRKIRGHGGLQTTAERDVGCPLKFAANILWALVSSVIQKQWKSTILVTAALHTSTKIELTQQVLMKPLPYAVCSVTTRSRSSLFLTQHVTWHAGNWRQLLLLITYLWLHITKSIQTDLYNVHDIYTHFIDESRKFTSLDYVSGAEIYYKFFVS